MALPLTPIALFALRTGLSYGAVALTAYAIARAAIPAPHDQRAEDAMNDLSEGLALRRSQDRLHAGGRYRRVVRLGPNGPGVEIDAAGIGRLRWRRL